MVWEELSTEEFQNGDHSGHLGYRNGMILAFINVHIALMHPAYVSVGGENISFEEFQLDGCHNDHIG